DDNVAMHVRRDRRQLPRPDVRLELQVPEEKLVRERLASLCEQPALTQLSRRAGRGVRIGQNVERVDSVPTVRLDLLVHDARGDRKLRAGRKTQCGANSTARAAIDVLVGQSRR